MEEIKMSYKQMQKATYHKDQRKILPITFSDINKAKSRPILKSEIDSSGSNMCWCCWEQDRRSIIILKEADEDRGDDVGICLDCLKLMLKKVEDFEC